MTILTLIFIWNSQLTILEIPCTVHQLFSQLLLTESLQCTVYTGNLNIYPAPQSFDQVHPCFIKIKLCFNLLEAQES